MGGFFPRAFNDFWNDDTFSKFITENQPATNVSENQNGFNVDLSIPGFDKGDINLEIDKNILKVTGKIEEKKEENDGGHKVLRQEFTHASFARSFVLPENIDVENISAKHEHGILKIVLPKKKVVLEDKVKTIKIG
jgi:HSP20 family protein